MSSVRNSSKLLPVPGRTITSGPLGTLAQPARKAAATRDILTVERMFVSFD
jgi:hypothetical protein